MIIENSKIYMFCPIQKNDAFKCLDFIVGDNIFLFLPGIFHQLMHNPQAQLNA